jgi:hypothetical protein
MCVVCGVCCVWLGQGKGRMGGRGGGEGQEAFG